MTLGDGKVGRASWMSNCNINEEKFRTKHHSEVRAIIVIIENLSGFALCDSTSSVNPFCKRNDYCVVTKDHVTSGVGTRKDVEGIIVERGTAWATTNVG